MERIKTSGNILSQIRVDTIGSKNFLHFGSVEQSDSESLKIKLYIVCIIQTENICLFGVELTMSTKNKGTHF